MKFFFSWTENSDILKKSVTSDSYILEIQKSYDQVYDVVAQAIPVKYRGGLFHLL